MKKTFLLCVMAFALLILAGCGESFEEDISYAMGSAVTQKIYGGHKDTASRAKEEIARLDGLISYRDKNSVVYSLNTGKEESDAKVTELIEKSLEISKETNGVYDITVLPLVKEWGFDGDLSSCRLPSEDAIKSCLSKIGYSSVIVEDGKVRLENGVELDLSAVGKGEACEAAVNVYKTDSVTGGIVTVGGSVGVYGKKDDGSLFTVGVRNPFDKNGLIGTLTLTDCFVSTSGSYEKNFTENGVTYHHLLDATTGHPAESGLVSVTVVCSDGGESDSLASACFCVGLESSLPILENHNANAVFITTDGKIYVTPGLEGFFEAESFEVIRK